MKVDNKHKRKSGTWQMEEGNQGSTTLKFKASESKNLSPARICSELIKFSDDGSVRTLVRIFPTTCVERPDSAQLRLGLIDSIQHAFHDLQCYQPETGRKVPKPTCRTRGILLPLALIFWSTLII